MRAPPSCWTRGPTNGAPSSARSSAFDGRCCRFCIDRVPRSERSGARSLCSVRRWTACPWSRPRATTPPARSPVLHSSSSQASIYISCGTWALVGCELLAPLTTGEALQANVTNELGVGNTTRFLKNVTGLWLLEECRRSWESAGSRPAVDDLVAAATALPGGLAVIDPDDPAASRNRPHA